MRIAFTPHAYFPSIGGAEGYTRNLAEAMATHGVDVHVVVPAISSPEAFYELGHDLVAPAEEQVGGVAIHRLSCLPLRYRLGTVTGRKAGINAMRSRYRGALSDALQRLIPDVVVALPHRFPNVEEVVALRRYSDWKLLYAPMLHEADPYWSLDAIASCVSASDGILALTSHEKQRLVEAYGATPDRVALVSPSMQGFGRTNGTRDPMVLFVGRSSPAKRLDVLFDAMSMVWRDHPDAQLVVAGRGVSDLSDAVGHNLTSGSPRVELIESPSDERKQDLFRRAAVVVNPSLVESFGIVTLEAWASSTPIVAVDTPVNQSVIRDGRDGVLTGSSADELAQGIDRLLAEPGEARRLGNAGGQRLEAEFSADRSRRLLMELVDKVTA